MPVITFTGDKLDDQKKRLLIQRLTVVSAEISGKPEQLFTVLINELDDRNIGVGGKDLAEIKSKH